MAALGPRPVRRNWIYQVDASSVEDTPTGIRYSPSSTGRTMSVCAVNASIPFRPLCRRLCLVPLATGCGFPFDISRQPLWLDLALVKFANKLDFTITVTNLLQLYDRWSSLQAIDFFFTWYSCMDKTWNDYCVYHRDLQQVHHWQLLSASTDVWLLDTVALKAIRFDRITRLYTSWKPV